MNIIELAQKRDEIMAAQDIYCPLCGQRQFSPFDKLFTKYMDKCVDCTDMAEDIVAIGNQIFQIIEG